jgi:hypothetical protein
MNIADSNFCRVCGNQIAPFDVTYIEDTLSFDSGSQVILAENGVAAGNDDYGVSAVNATFVPVTGGHGSLLERLDKMERELEENRREPLPESALNPADELDKYEETLKNIAYTLDSLITDLLEAEAGEYSFPGFIRPEDTPSEAKDESAAQPAKEAVKQDIEPGKKSKRLQEILILFTLIAAIFMVGLSFGLWGSYFFGR